jgi:hypothetical protein
MSGEALAVRCRLALTYAEGIRTVAPGPVRLSEATLYASIFRLTTTFFSTRRMGQRGGQHARVPPPPAQQRRHRVDRPDAVVFDTGGEPRRLQSPGIADCDQKLPARGYSLSIHRRNVCSRMWVSAPSMILCGVHPLDGSTKRIFGGPAQSGRFHAPVKSRRRSSVGDRRHSQSPSDRLSTATNRGSPPPAESQPTGPAATIEHERLTER